MVQREKDASTCQEQLDEFRKLIRTFQKWLKETEGNVPPAETFVSAKELEKQIEHLKVGKSVHIGIPFFMWFYMPTISKPKSGISELGKWQ